MDQCYKNIHVSTQIWLLFNVYAITNFKVQINPVLVSGLVRTDIFRHADPALARLMALAFTLLGKSPWQGCQTTLEAVLCQDTDLGGQYLQDCKPTSFWAHRSLGDRELEDRIWEATRKVIGV